MNNIRKAKLEQENQLKKLIQKQFEYLDEQKKKIVELEKAIKEKQILNYSNVFDKKYLVEKIYLNVIGYYEQNSQNKNISFAPIRGGCLSEINNNLKLIDISNASQNEKLNQILNTINQNDNLEVIFRR
jgi:hypothetical protein